MDLAGLNGHFLTSRFVLNSQAHSFYFSVGITWRFLIIKHQVRLWHLKIKIMKKF